MTAIPPTADETVVLSPPPRWEITRVLQGALRHLRWGLRLVLLGGAVLVAAQVASVYRLLADIHPWVGWAGAVVFAGLLAWLLGRPLLALLRLPTATAPPKMPPLAERGPREVQRQLRYLRRYLDTLARNPELEGDARSRVEAARAALASLQVDAAADFEPLTWGKHLVAWERDHLQPLLAPLDRRADALIRKEALAIATMTALSPNGTVDAFLVLWRNLNLVAALARIYYGRPGVRGTWLIVRDVASAILLSSVLEQLSDLGGSLLRKVGEGGRTLPLVGAMVGPALDGTLNGLMALKVGYLAKERCRSFQAWDERTTQGVLKRTFRLVSESAGFLMEEMQRTVLGSLSFVRATADAGRSAVHGAGLRTWGLLRGLGRIFRGRTEDPPPAGEGP